MVIANIKSGLDQVWANQRMVMIFYVTNLLSGLVLMLPFRAAATKFAGNTLMGGDLAGRLPMDFVFELFHNNKSLFPVYGVLFVAVAALYGLLSLFMSGGAFVIFASGERYSGAAFWAGAGKYFGRFARLFLWSVPVFGALFCLQFAASGIQRLLFGADPYETVIYWGAWVRFGLRIAGFLLYMIVLDYARIHAVTTGEARMRIALWHGVKFTLANIGSVLGVAGAIYLAGILVLVVYNPLADALAAPNAVVVMLLFVLQQLYMVFRMTLRLVLYSSQLNLHNKLAGAPGTYIIPAEPDGLEGAAA